MKIPLYSSQITYYEIDYFIFIFSQEITDRSTLDTAALKTDTLYNCLGHTDQKTAGQKSYCVICKMPFVMKCFVIHAKQLHSQNVFKSSRKNDTASFRREIVLMKSCVTKQQQFSCTICRAIFVDPITAELHLKALHLCETLYTCGKCGKLNNLEEKKYDCHICGRSFKKGEILRDHISTHLRDEEKPYKCDVCSKCFASKSHWSRHQLLHKDDNPFKCKICQKVFISQHYFSQHMRVHSGEKPFKCSFCEKCFAHSSTLRDHEKLHSDERKFKCHICQQGFIKDSKLKLHLLTHSDVKPYQCKLCFKQFTTSTRLKSHEATHTDEKPYVCFICGVGYVSKKGLQWHEDYTHGGKTKPKKKKVKRSFLCCTCNKQFYSTLDSFQKHVKFHVAETIFQCSKCPLKFYRSSHWKNHEKHCTGEIREFVCTLCSATFATKASLLNHQKGTLCNINI